MPTIASATMPPTSIQFTARSVVAQPPRDAELKYVGRVREQLVGGRVPGKVDERERARESRVAARRACVNSLPRTATKPSFQFTARTPMPTTFSVQLGELRCSVSPTPHVEVAGEPGRQERLAGVAREAARSQQHDAVRDRIVQVDVGDRGQPRGAVGSASPMSESDARPLQRRGCRAGTPAWRRAGAGVRVELLAARDRPRRTGAANASAGESVFARTSIVTTVIPHTGTAMSNITSSVRPGRRRTSRRASRSAKRHRAPGRPARCAGGGAVAPVTWSIVVVIALRRASTWSRRRRGRRGGTRTDRPTTRSAARG